MAWKLGAATGALLALAGLTGLAATDGDQSARRAAYARPAAIPFPESNPYTRAKAELGRSLFFDPILSGPGTRSCASCHLPGLAWADGRARAARLDGGDADLRTPTLLNVAWSEGRLGWDGKFADLEAVAFAPITGPTNMHLSEAEAVARLSAHPTYARAFAEAFPSALACAACGVDAQPVTRARVEAALATFERLIVSGTAPFDRWVAGDEAAIPAAAKRGLALFDGKANCAACHGGWAFTDGSFHDIGSARGDDVGRGRYVPNSLALRHAFRTPTLRDVSVRAPYMHDGSVPTLAAVVDLYDRGGIDRPSRSREIRPLGLTPAEKADLVAFLETLTEAQAHPAALGPLTAEPPKP